MKRHTNINIRKIGLGVFVLAILLFGGVAFCQPSWANVTKTQDVKVRFTFNSTLNLSVSQDTITIGSLASGTVEESEPVTISVATNNAGGYYLSATAGTKGENTDLVNSSTSTKFTHLGSDASKTAKDELEDNTWGVAFTDGGSEVFKSYTGLPLDGGDEGASGKKLLETTTAADSKNVKLKVAAKAGAAQAAGTYTNKINFYAVAK